MIIHPISEAQMVTFCRRGPSAGAELAITYLTAEAEPYVRPLAAELQSEIFMPCDVTVPDQLEAVCERVSKDWGRLDFVQHSIACARKEDLHGRITDCTAEGFAFAMRVSVHSFLHMVKLAEPLMTAGGRSLAMSDYGAETAIARYNVMGSVKAAPEAVVRYMPSGSGRRGSASTHSRRVQRRRGLPPAAGISTSCWSGRSAKNLSTRW